MRWWWREEEEDVNVLVRERDETVLHCSSILFSGEGELPESEVVVEAFLERERERESECMNVSSSRERRLVCL